MKRIVWITGCAVALVMTSGLGCGGDDGEDAASAGTGSATSSGAGGSGGASSDGGLAVRRDGSQVSATSEVLVADQAVGTSSEPVSFTIQALGSSPVHLTGSLPVIVEGASFTVTKQPPATLEPGKDETFSIVFTPAEVGAASASVRIENDAPGGSFVFDLRGNGVAPAGVPMFVGAGYGARRTSSLDGITWTNNIVVDPNGGDDNNLFRGVGFGDGMFVAVGGGGKGQSMTTRDGATWENEQHDLRAFLSDVAWLSENGTFVAAGGNGFRVRSKDGCATWTDDPGYYAGHFRGIAAGNGVFVAAGHTYGDQGTKGLSSTTADGVTWSPEVTGGAGFSAIAFGNGVFVAVGSGGRASVSADGASWKDATLDGGKDLNGVSFVNGEFIVGASDGFLRSKDGASWEAVGGANTPSGIEFGLGVYVGGRWPGRIDSSTDLLKWTVRSEGEGPAISDFVFGYAQKKN